MAKARPKQDEDTINLADATVMLLESSQHALDVLSQIIFGFGVREVVRCLSVEEAAAALGLSRSTAYEHWAFGRAWLGHVLGPADEK